MYLIMNTSYKDVMEKDYDKIRQLEEIMDLECGVLSPETRLDELTEWDSLAIISFLALTDRNKGGSVDISRLRQAYTIKDLIKFL